MKKIILLISLLIIISSQAFAKDTADIGVRAGGETDRSSYITEIFGDFYINKFLTVGGALAVQVLESDNKKSLKRDESFPIAATVKFHAPLPIINPYAGLGEAIIFHDKSGVTGSPLILAGINFKPLPIPVFVGIEYRHQLNGELNLLTGGVGVKF